MLQPGSLLGGRYAIREIVGTGGMGSVYAAHDERLGRDVAIKLLRPDLAAIPKERQRFLTEGQIAAQVVHPNIVRNYDAGDDPEGPFLVQELLLGHSLDRALPLPVNRAIAVIDGIAGALAALHQRGYLHLDVKPHNIWLRPNGEPVLLDFGIARAEGTVTTTLIATPQYLAPERAEGAAPSAASDLYSLGVVFFQVLTGRLPFDGATMQDILAAHINAPIPLLGIADVATPDLQRIINRLLAKRPVDRYVDAAALQADLAALRAQPRGVQQVQGQPTVPVVPRARMTAGPAAALPPLRQAPAIRLPPKSRADPRLLLPLLLLVPLLLVLWGVRNGLAHRFVPAAAPGATEVVVPKGEIVPSAAPVPTPGSAQVPTTVPTAAMAPAITVPDVRGQTVEQATAMLQGANLQLQLLGQQQSDAPPDTVIAQNPAPGAPLPTGGAIQVITSGGGEQDHQDLHPLPAPPLPAGPGNGRGKGKKH